MITLADREAAWPYRRECYKLEDKEAWMAGRYDASASIIQDFAAYRQKIVEDMTTDLMDMAKAYKLGSPESQAVITATQYARVKHS